MADVPACSQAMFSRMTRAATPPTRAVSRASTEGFAFVQPARPRIVATVPAPSRRRDDFPATVVDVLARRVGMRCSNPNCRRLTSGPSSDPTRTVNVGEAAHLTAAAPGGPRYDPALTPEERRAPENGIWLCRPHAKLVDNDPARFPVDLLRDWKRLAEAAAALEVDGAAPAPTASEQGDVDLVRFFAQCFDRPAFQDPFRQEGSAEALDRAISDTLTAINTGCLRSRDGTILAQARGGKTFLTNPGWRRCMDEVADLLRALRARYEGARRAGVLRTGDNGGGREWQCINDAALADWMDQTRGEALRVFAEVCRQAGVEAPLFPRVRQGHW